MLIFENDDKCRIMKRYVELMKIYHIKKRSDLAHIIENDKVINTIVEESYRRKNITLSDSQQIGSLRRVIDKCIKQIKTNDLNGIILTEEELNCIRCIKTKRVKAPSKTKILNYNRQVIVRLIEGIYKDYGNNKFNTLKSRPLLYELIRDRYKIRTSKVLDVPDKVLSKIVSSTGLFRVENYINSKIRKYISERYNKGVRIFYLDIVCKDIQADITIVRRSIHMDEFPGIIILRTVDYKLTGRNLKILKSKDYNKISTLLIKNIKLEIPHATFAQICYIISNNYFEIFKKEYEGKDIMKERERLRDRIRERKKSISYLEKMKHDYNLDIISW